MEGAVVSAFGGAELGDRCAAARNRQDADLILIIRTLGGCSAAEGKLIARDLGAVAGLHRQHDFALPGGGGDDADDREADARVRK